MTSPAGRIATLSLFVGAAVAQSASSIIGNLSSTCQNGAESLISTPFATCADVTGLVSIMSTTGSVVDPVNTWAASVCGQAPCSSSDITAASQNIQQNCSSDIASGNVAAVALDTITTNFNDVRNLLCLQASSNKTFCITDFLGNVQNATGQQLTVSTLMGMLSVSGLEAEAQKLPTSTFCTDCNSAIMNQALSGPLLNSTEQTALKSAASQECGASFGTSMPSDVKEASSSSSSAASRSVSIGLSLGAISGIVASLAAAGFGTLAVLL